MDGSHVLICTGKREVGNYIQVLQLSLLYYVPLYGVIICDVGMTSQKSEGTIKVGMSGICS